MNQVFAHILVWNDRRYLSDLLASLTAQTHPNLTVRILDNGSTDGSLDYLKERVPHAVVGRNVKNLGFAEGHNQLIRFTLGHLEQSAEEPFILVMNSDMILKESLVAELVRALASNPELGAVQPKLYRAFGEHVGDETLEETSQSDILDTTGLLVRPGWRMVDRGAGELDKGQYDQALDLFGPTGTMALFRVSALREVMEGDDFYDGDFFAYREDCDLAWRFRRLGWKTHFVPTAVAWHYRGMYGAQKQSWWQRLKNRRSQRPFFAALSTRNQLFVLLKNLTILGFVLALPWIIVHELGRAIYGFVFEKETRKRLLTMWPLVPKMLRKRKSILGAAKVAEGELRSYVR